MELLFTGYAPVITAVLVAGATIAIWLALAPARPGKAVSTRLEGFVGRGEMIGVEELDQPLAQRTIVPAFHGVLRFFGKLMPQKNMDELAHQLQRAGDPGGLTVLDFVGLRILLAVGAAALVIVFFSRNEGPLIMLRNGAVALLAGFWLPKLWLNNQIKKRKSEIARALPDALDMLTIGVEAGLAFESALLRVGEQWNNALSQEFRRVVSEMRLGVPRNEVLRRLAERTDVEDLSTFVAVLIQSNMLGVSISQVLHVQADQMRLKRRQHAEEQAHAATVKIVVVLVIFILPSLFIVVLGPTVPRIAEVLQMASSR
jgi:tight adherence protein C